VPSKSPATLNLNFKTTRKTMDTIIRIAALLVVSYVAIQFFGFIFAGMGPFFLVLIPGLVLWVWLAGGDAQSQTH
jgi:hypothetical protein